MKFSSVKFFLIIFICLSTILSARTIDYSLVIEHPEKHLASIEMQIPITGLDSITVALPAWAPGRYVIYNFSKNLFDLQAVDQTGRTLWAELLDKQT